VVVVAVAVMALLIMRLPLAGQVEVVVVTAVMRLVLLAQLRKDTLAQLVLERLVVVVVVQQK